MAWTPCYSTPLEFQAYLVKGYLEQYGVPCLVESSRFEMNPLTFCALGEVRVLVRDEWLLVAQGLIRGREKPPRRRLRLVHRRSDA
jgi:hypothetical protein